MTLPKFYKEAADAAKGIFHDPSGGSEGQNTNIIREHMQKALDTETADLKALLREIVPEDPDDDLIYTEAAGWHCEYCDRRAGPDNEYVAKGLELFEHRDDCWLVRAREMLVNS